MTANLHTADVLISRIYLAKPLVGWSSRYARYSMPRISSNPSVAYTSRDVTFRSQVHTRFLVHNICQYVGADTANRVPEYRFQSLSGSRSVSLSKTESSSLATHATSTPPRQARALMQLWVTLIISVSVLPRSPTDHPILMNGLQRGS